MFEWILFNSFNYVVHLMLVIGLVGLLLASLVKNVYSKILLPVFLVIFLASLYFEGILACKKEYDITVKKFSEKIKTLEEKSQQVNEVIKTVYVDRVEIIKEKGKDNVKYIETVVTKYDNLCTLSNAAISVHNSASQNEVARSTTGIDGETSNVKISELLNTITENYTTYYQTREQVIGWQQWYNEQKKIFESIK